MRSSCFGVVVVLLVSQMGCGQLFAETARGVVRNDRYGIEANTIATNDLVCDDDVEVTRVSGGYIAKACGKWEQITCPDPFAQVRPRSGDHCEGEGVMKIYAPPLKTEGPWSAQLQLDGADSFVVTVQKDGHPMRAPFAITSPPGWLAPIRPYNGWTGADGKATFRVDSLMPLLLPAPDVDPLKSAMPEVVLHVGDQVIDVRGSLEPAYQSWLSATVDRRREIVEEELRSKTCSAARGAKMNEVVREVRQRLGDLGKVSEPAFFVAREGGVNIAVKPSVGSIVELVVVGSDPVSVTAADGTETRTSQRYAMSVARTTGFYAAATELDYSVDFTGRPRTVDVTGRGCALVVPIVREIGR